jgi:hypothetical protein
LRSDLPQYRFTLGQRLDCLVGLHSLSGLFDQETKAFSVSPLPPHVTVSRPHVEVCFYCRAMYPLLEAVKEFLPVLIVREALTIKTLLLFDTHAVCRSADSSRTGGGVAYFTSSTK